MRDWMKANISFRLLSEDAYLRCIRIVEAARANLIALSWTARPEM
jgi:hypothetical protein